MTFITINEKLKTAVVCTDNPAKRKKLKTIAELTPEKCELRGNNSDGLETYWVDSKLIRIKTPLRHTPEKVPRGRRSSEGEKR